MDIIMSSCKGQCTQAGLQPTKTNIFNTYVANVKAHVHVLLAFSPVGAAFRTRLRMFPSLVNCCTVNWFAEWPAEALYSVAEQQLTVEDLKLPNLEGVLSIMKVIHQSIEKNSLRFYDELKRRTYVTPTSYLELISMFQTILSQQRGVVGTFRSRYQTGLDKLN